MISSLHIENIAVIEKVDMNLESGFTILTGETGAGKSILIDAIQMALGQRASKELIRTGQKSAFVGLVFIDIPNSAAALLREHGIEPEEDGNLLIQRELHMDGRSAAKINGRPVPLSVLKAVGETLVVIHGQHDNQDLLRPETHLSYVDEAARNIQLREDYNRCFDEAKALRGKISALRSEEAKKEQRIEKLSGAIQEIDRAAITPGEQAKLMEERSLLIHAEKIAGGASGAYAALYEDEISAFSLLIGCEAPLHECGKYSGDIASLAKRVTDIKYEIRDISEELSDILSRIDFSPERLEDVEGRLSFIENLCKKYAKSEEELIGYADSCREELLRLESMDNELESLQAQLAEQILKLKESAAALSQSRKKAAAELKRRIEQELSFLDMPKVSFETEFKEAEKFLRSGVDIVEFLISANPGEQPKPLAKIASGGELSRIMLSMKTVLSGENSPDSMIFDEIDTGVSGKAAEKIGRKLLQVSSGAQVICITHLAQIAALADQHYLIEKTVTGQRTHTSLKRMTDEGKVQELARIIGGIHITQPALEAAKDMLSRKREI